MDDDKSLAREVSRETAISLQELDPAPIEPTADYTEEQPLAPVSQGDDASRPTSAGTSSPAGTSALGLSGSGHGAIYYLSRIQRYSSYTLTIFTSIHLATTSVVPLITRSVPASEAYLLLAREIYQTRWSEPLLVGVPILAHVASGVAMRLIRRAQNARRYGHTVPSLWDFFNRTPAKAKQHRGWKVWPPLSVISASGYAFTVAVLSHVFVNRILPLAVEGDSADIGLAYVAHGFARHPATSWLAYSALLAVGCGHMVWGWAKWLGLAQHASWSSSDLTPTGKWDVDKKRRKRRRRVWLAIQGGVVAAVGIWAAGGLGVVARGGRMQGWVAKLYDGLFEKVGL